ncbi:MAG: PcfJ domain-containing protein [Deltaproteobacteria bacterium]|nr:PcfJ domain-containing protein [Deltaproteobacteria bacterium]
MSALSLRRHHRRLLDHVLHLALAGFAEPEARAAFVALLDTVRTRSDLLSAAPAIRRRRACFDHVDALVHLARWWREHRAAPETWPGRRGHPRVVLHDLQQHLFGLYPTPRFLGQVWLLDRPDADAWRGWMIAHARGTALRALALPIALTRAMARHFLATAEHVPVAIALREAEVLGLGGSPALARAVSATWLGGAFEHGAYWRAALAWIARHAPAIDQVGPILDYLEAARAWSAVPPVAGRSVASLWRQVGAWHDALGRVRPGGCTWASTGWAGRDEREPDGVRQICWQLVELRDDAALGAEGDAMRHCVYTYRSRCCLGQASIWSLRRRVEQPGDFGRARAVATIEVDPRTRTIVQLRAFANGRVKGPGVDVIRRWASDQGLRWSGEVLATLAA